MSSRFVSAGSIDATTGSAAVAAAASPPPPPAAAARDGRRARANQWETVQKELEADRQRREEQRKAAAQGGEKSLFEVLQANKAAKQAAFEEANKIKNQFRALDDDEIDFLEGVRESARAEEERRRRETEEGLQAFRAAQRRTDTAGSGTGTEGGDGEDGEVLLEEEWAFSSGRRRKREREKDRERDGVLKGVKRKASESEQQLSKVEVVKRAVDTTPVDAEKEEQQQQQQREVVVSAPPSVAAKKAAKVDGEAPTKKLKLSLVDYGSSGEDED